MTFFKVTLPLIRGGVIAGGVAAFLISFDNISLSLFITRGDTLPLRLMQQLLAYADPSISAISTLLVLVSLVGMVFLLPLAMRQR
jgi:putative spermidine/putrescine transport system permease protein